MKMRTIALIATTLLVMNSCCDTASQTCPATEQQCATAQTAKNIESITFSNDDFYTDGKFDQDKAKDAVIALMEYHYYPVFDSIREQLWVSDYGTGQFTKLGLAAICQVNDTQDLYMLQDIYLLPGQMLPEHWHLKPEGLPAKMEAWFIRNGESYIAGIGEDNMASFPEVKIPECHMHGTVTEKHVTLTKAGELTKLAKVGSRHWQYAGPEGAIMSEVANVHSNQDVRHSDKKLNDNFLGI